MLEMLILKDYLFKVYFKTSFYFPVDTGRKLNVHKTLRRRPGRLLNVLCTFYLRPVSTGFASYYSQKQPPEELCKKTVFKNFAVSTGTHLCLSLFLIKLQTFRPATLLKKDSNTGVFL